MIFDKQLQVPDGRQAVGFKDGRLRRRIRDQALGGKQTDLRVLLSDETNELVASSSVQCQPAPVRRFKGPPTSSSAVAILIDLNISTVRRPRVLGVWSVESQTLFDRRVNNVSRYHPGTSVQIFSRTQ